MKQRNHFRAFTLLEVLVATAVFLLMVTLLFSALSQVNSAWLQTESQKSRREIGRSIVDLITRDLQGAIRPLPGETSNRVNFELGMGTIGDHDSGNVFWQARTPISRRKSDIATLGYFVGTNHTLYRVFTNAACPNISSEAETMAMLNGGLADGIVRMGVKAFDKDGSEIFLPATFTTNLPAFVEIMFAVADTRTLQRFPGLTVPDFDNPPAGIQVFKSLIDIPCAQ